MEQCGQTSSTLAAIPGDFSAPRLLFKPLHLFPFLQVNRGKGRLMRVERTFSCLNPTSYQGGLTPCLPPHTLPLSRSEGDSLGPHVFCFGFCLVNSSWQSLCAQCPAVSCMELLSNQKEAPSLPINLPAAWPVSQAKSLL